MKKFLMKLKTALVSGVVGAFGVVNIAHAEGEDYLAPINNLKGILVSVASAVGAIVLIAGIAKFAAAFKNGDNQSERNAVMTIVAGALLVGAGILIGIIAPGTSV